MQNLCLCNSRTVSLSNLTGSSGVRRFAIDSDQQTIYLLTSHSVHSLTLDTEIVKSIYSSTDPTTTFEDLCFLSELNHLCLGLSNGDLVSLQFEHEFDQNVNAIGTLEECIHELKSSPDQQILTAVTNTKVLLLSTNNDYEPIYRCDLAMEAAILGSCSLLLTIVNIICIIIMALFILRIKEVVPLHQPNQDIVNFFHHDVKVARDYNKTIHATDTEINNLTRLTMNRTHLAQSIVSRWKLLRSATSHDNQCHQTTEPLSTMTKNIESIDKTNRNSINIIDTESRRRLFRLKTFCLCSF